MKNKLWKRNAGLPQNVLDSVWLIVESGVPVDDVFTTIVSVAPGEAEPLDDLTRAKQLALWFINTGGRVELIEYLHNYDQYKKLDSVFELYDMHAERLKKHDEPVEIKSMARTVLHSIRTTLELLGYRVEGIHE